MVYLVDEESRLFVAKMSTESKTPFKVAVIPFVHVGHMNPLLAMVKELVDSGVEVVFFGEASVKKNILKSGARYVSLYDGCFDDEVVSAEDYFTEWKAREGLCFDKFPLMRVQETSKYLVPLMRNLKLENPDAILHDTFCVEAYIVGKLLNIPLISHISYSGMGVLGDQAWKNAHGVGWDSVLTDETYKKWQEIFIARFNVDIWAENLPMQYYSEDLIITTMIKDLCLHLNEEDDSISYKFFKDRQEEQIYVGPCFNDKLRLNGKPTALPKDEIVEDDPVPIILKAKKEGKRIVFVSFGTVITQNLWEYGDQFPIGGIGSGKDFYTIVAGHLVEAFGEDDNIVVLMATGLKANGLENKIPVPSNFILRKRVAQTEILKLTDCFISHMGANSMNEALEAGVPLVPMPGFADQMTNGKLTIKAGAAYAEWDQDLSGADCSAEAIKRSVDKVLTDPSFAENSKLLGDKNRNAGGAKRASEVMLDFLAKQRDSRTAQSSHLLRKTPSSCAMEIGEQIETVHTQVS